MEREDWKRGSFLPVDTPVLHFEGGVGGGGWVGGGGNHPRRHLATSAPKREGIRKSPSYQGRDSSEDSRKKRIHRSRKSYLRVCKRKGDIIGPPLWRDSNKVRGGVVWERRRKDNGTADHLAKYRSYLVKREGEPHLAFEEAQSDRGGFEKRGEQQPQCQATLAMPERRENRRGRSSTLLSPTTSRSAQKLSWSGGAHPLFLTPYPP